MARTQKAAHLFTLRPALRGEFIKAMSICVSTMALITACNRAFGNCTLARR